MADAVFKVVAARWQGDEVVLLSSLMELNGDHMVEYRPGVEVKPVVIRQPDGHIYDSYLVAFRDRKSAIDYVDSAKGLLTNYVALQVWTATGRIICTDPMQGVEIDPFWHQEQHGFDRPHPNVLPCSPGSVWCESLTLNGLIHGSSPRKPSKPVKKVRAEHETS